MQELSMNILDIAQNSISAGATEVDISLRQSTARRLQTLEICDNGRGMDEEAVKNVTDPFFTSRTTRRVGLGVPFLKMAAEMADGAFAIESEPGKGTNVTATFALGHIDLMPLGDIGETMSILAAANPDIDFSFTCEKDGEVFAFTTQEIKKTLDGVSLSKPAVAVFLKEYIGEHVAEVLQTC